MAQTIRNFANSTRLWHRLFLGGASLAFHALVVGLLLLVVDFFWPASYGVALWLALGWLLIVLSVDVLRRGGSLHAADRTLGLRDQLVTWWEVQAAPADPVFEWLEDDLEQVIKDLPPDSRSPLWRRSARRLWWLLPALLLVWWAGPLGHHLGMHSKTGNTRQASAGAPRSSDSKGGPGSGSWSKKPEPGQEKSRPPSTRPGSAQETPDPPQTPPDRSKSAQPPRPLHTMAAQDEFIIPRFVGDGVGAVKRMKVAVVEQGEGSRNKTRRQQIGTSTSQEDRRPEFEAAAERALRARHVPRSERPFVKRYFKALLEERR
ncbi:MAG: hypothetical protein VX951_04435 [Planctomycetota bacterium]|nr:hypothetical protein [Planctomycetota bacterium]